MVLGRLEKGAVGVSRRPFYYPVSSAVDEYISPLEEWPDLIRAASVSSRVAVHRYTSYVRTVPVHSLYTYVKRISSS